MIGSALSQDQALRAAVVAAAQARVQTVPPPTTQSSIDQTLSEIEGLGVLRLPVGWTGQPLPWASATGTSPKPTDVPRDPGAWVQKLLGLLVTAAAVSLGAPFWFDMLNKAVNLRAAGQPPKRTGETPDDASQVRPVGSEQAMSAGAGATLASMA
jgi:hypothetical protein